MRTKMKWIAIAVSSLAVLVLVGLCAAAFWLVRQQEQARSQFAPPTVLVNEPASGESVPVGNYVFVSATAFGLTPISRMELWVDGEAMEIQERDLSEGVSPFYAHFGFPASEGPHMLFVRAVNTAGIIGQSLPVGILGGPQTSPEQTVLTVSVQEGQTLDDIASTYGTYPETLQTLNPDLRGQEPSPGTAIIVPVLPGEEAPPASVGPTVSPSVPGSTPVLVPDAPPLKTFEPAPLPLDLPVAFLAVSPPAAPTDLEAQVQECRVRLRWNDKATNEEFYEVRMAGLGSAGRVISKLEPAAGGAAWVSIAAPQPGYFSFWVEAVNRLGRQPSNIALVYVDPACPTTLATHLQVEALDMTVSTKYDKVYCYVSFEDAAEMRIPEDDSAFVQVQAGHGDIAAWAAGSHGLVVPIPADNTLEITGECLGWSGAELEKLGSLSGNYAADTWDGSRRPLQSGAFQIGIVIEPLGALGTTGTPEAYAYEDTSLPFPYDVREDRSRSPSFDVDPLQRALSWKWDADSATIDGFQIFLNGAPYNLGWLPEPPLVSPSARSMEVRLPHSCGEHVLWQVAAIAGPAQSRLSAPSPYNDYDQPKCDIQARVKFEEIRLDWSSDGGGECDILEVYFQFSLNGGYRSFGYDMYCGAGPTIFDWLEKCNYGEVSSIYGMHCGAFDLFDIIGGSRTSGRDEITVPIHTDAIDLTFRTRFVDQDEGADDAFGEHTERHFWPSLEAAQQDLGCSKTFVSSYSETDTARTRLTYTIAVYPNRCHDRPPAQGF
jgi:hypothetical protein